MAAGTPKLYDNAVQNVATNTRPWGTTAKRVILLNNSHSFTATNTVYSNISANEVTGTGYSAGGAAVATGALSIDTGTPGVAKYKITANTVWNTSTITAYYAVIVDAATATASSPILCHVTLDNTATPAPVSSSNGTFTVAWNANGVFTLDHTP